MVKENQHYLLRYDDNWADEFDMSGFRVYSQEEYGLFKARLKKANYRGEVYFGTNEFVEYSDAKDYLRHVEVTKITEDEAKVMKKLIGEEYGIFLEPNETEDDE